MNLNPEDVWASDVVPSMPEPLKDKSAALASVGDGYCFTFWGLAHEITITDWEDIVIPFWGPRGHAGDDASHG